MDELLALFDEEPPSSDPQIAESSERDDLSVPDHEDSSVQESTSPVGADGDRLAATSDAKTGIRMINRLISGADLLDLLMENPFHSPASLCAMSSASLNRLLVDPAGVVDASTLCGRTNMVTVGIVFSNTGTRMSSNGNAFCVLTLGSLQSGPAISVMLFGSAYATYCRSIISGKVVALLGPKLLPPKKDGAYARDTAVSFSVSDERQIRLVADARDYGTCPAPVRGKNEVGQWVNDARTCGQYVDKSASKYCSKHRALERTKGIESSRAAALSAGSAPKASNALQQIRNDARMSSRTFDATSNQQRVLGFPTSSAPPVASQEGPRQSLSDQILSQLQDGRPGSLRSRASHQLTESRSSSTNSILNPPNAARLCAPISLPSRAAAPLVGANASSQGLGVDATRNRVLDPKLANNSILNPKASKTPLDASRSSDPPLLRRALPDATSLKNPYAKRSMPPSALPTEPANDSDESAPRGTSSNRREDLTTDDWLQDTTNRKAGKVSRRGLDPKRKKKVKLNTDAACFDGSVPVPKPSLTFANSRPQRPTADVPPPRQLSRTQTLDPNRRDELLALQGEMAAKLRELKSSSDLPKIRHVTPRHGAGGRDERPQQGQERQSIFGGEMSIDLDAVKAATSKFANEAAAEDYARHRNRLVELEELEESKEAAASKRNPQQKHSSSMASGAGHIQKEWFCKSCKRSFKAFPKHCGRAGHPIQTKRTIQETKTTGDKRQALSDTRSEDGGLKIGSGLEWSRFR